MRNSGSRSYTHHFTHGPNVIMWTLPVVRGTGRCCPYQCSHVSSSNLGRRVLAVISCGCCNTLPKTWCFKTTEMYPLTVLEARCPKPGSLGWNQGVRAGLPTSGSSQRRMPSLPLENSDACQPSMICGHITPFPASGIQLPSLLPR